MDEQRYTQEFRLEAVRQVLDKRQPISQLAGDLGIPVATLQEWVDAEHSENFEDSSKPPKSSFLRGSLLLRLAATAYALVFIQGAIFVVVTALVAWFGRDPVGFFNACMSEILQHFALCVEIGSVWLISTEIWRPKRVQEINDWALGANEWAFNVDRPNLASPSNAWFFVFLVSGLLFVPVALSGLNHVLSLAGMEFPRLTLNWMGYWTLGVLVVPTAVYLIFRLIAISGAKLVVLVNSLTNGRAVLVIGLLLTLLATFLETYQVTSAHIGGTCESISGFSFRNVHP